MVANAVAQHKVDDRQAGLQIRRPLSRSESRSKGTKQRCLKKSVCTLRRQCEQTFSLRRPEPNSIPPLQISRQSPNQFCTAAATPLRSTLRSPHLYSANFFSMSMRSGSALISLAEYPNSPFNLFLYSSISSSSLILSAVCCESSFLLLPPFFSSF